MEQIDKIREILTDDPYDRGYFETHKQRFSTVFSIIQQHIDQVFQGRKDIRILELGSYHLHFLSMFKTAGYDHLYGLDLPSIVGKKLIRQRATDLNIDNHPYILNEIGKPANIPFENDQFDVIICLEMLEHITFNPVGFWHEVSRVSTDRGRLFIATPNALSLIKWTSRLRKLIFRRSYGISLHEIFNKITTGHHWKEYSPFEMNHYFGNLSDIFLFDKMESYRWRSYKTFNGFIRLIYYFQERILPAKFRSELFIIYRVNKHTVFSVKDPDNDFYIQKDS